MSLQLSQNLQSEATVQPDVVFLYLTLSICLSTVVQDAL